MTSHVSDFDRQMMGIALRMAERGLGLARPNPAVGAVIANEATGELISRGVTAEGGRPHAETIALAAAVEQAHGATIYVTLEPCSHHGHTGPCADAIIAAGIKRAVVAIEDPDPRVAGRGLERLRHSGIEVVRGLRAPEARWLTRGHIVRVTERRPFVTLKLALDADGGIARGGSGQPSWVTGPLARAHGHLLRATADAILVGRRTVIDDGPELTCRLPGMLARSPVRIALMGRARLSLESKLVQTAAVSPVWVMRDTDAGSDPSLRVAGVDEICVPRVGGHLWLPAVMEALVARGITRLLVEGGPTVWRAFADAALADEVVVFKASGARRDANDEVAILEIVARWIGSYPLTVTDRRTLQSDTMWRLRHLRPQEG